MDTLDPPQPANRTTEFVNKLNQRYNLDLQVPDLRLSPRKRIEAQTTNEAALAERIHSLIRQLASRRPDVLPRIELQFNQEARAICSNWVPKPHAASDLLPETSARPRASSAVERRQLRECLLEILKSHRPDHGNRGTAEHRQTQDLGYRKRLSDEIHQEPSGKPTTPHGSPTKKARSALDKVPVRVSSPALNGLSERDAIPVNRSFGLRDSLAATHPPRYHSFSGLPPPAASHTLGPHQSARPHSPHSFTGAPATGTHSFGAHDHRIMNQDSANTSRTTHNSAIFSFPPPDDSDSSQETVPNDDREEYKDLGPAVDVAFYGPQTPTRPDCAESAAGLDNGVTSGLTPLPSSSREEQDPTAAGGGGLEISREPEMQSKGSEDLNFPGVLPHSLDRNAVLGHAEATVAIRQRGPISSVPSIAATESTDWSADLDPQLPVYGRLPAPEESPVHRRPLPLGDRLRNSWPKLPEFLINAPLPVVWEVTRAALHCGVRLDDLCMQHDDSWRDLAQFRKALATHHEFKGKTLPDECDERAWRAAFSAFRYHGLSVTLAIEASYNHEKNGPLYSLSLQPLKLERSYRLARRFGADRFLEVIIPSPTDRDKNPGLKTDELIGLLAQSDHILLGRLWRSFFTKGDNKVDKQEVLTGTATKTLPYERMYLFAVDGNNFVSSISRTIPSKEEATSMDRRTKMEVDDLLEWAISISRNSKQPALKLFSRLALSMSRTRPTIVLEQHQIRQHDDDLRSPTGKVMNDGIGRMSPSLAKTVTKRLELDDQEMPSGFQGRIGPYKGFWVIDPFDDGEIWIEGYPSQRKWDCDFEDADHRTFEVIEWARRLTPGTLNEQFILVLEDRALVDRSGMKEAIRRLLEETVNRDLEEQTRATEDPMTLHAWGHQNASATRREKIASRQVPFLGGFPKSDEEALKVLLDAGFDSKLRYIQELTQGLARQRCERLKEKMKITVPQSAYAFMTVDFSGVLEEGEVHLAFSRASECDTRAPDGISRNELHGHDVLVARAPAHFPSDVQKVKAVFKPELRHLQDVIIFSIKGDVPLADLLSGGDYDGDKAWVCWDPSIVNHFDNAPVPEKPDLFKKYEGDTKGYLTKDTRTFEDILQSRGGNNPGYAVSEFLKDSFAFNMQLQLLGKCTIYKEKVCYKRGSVSDEKAIILSTLVSHLVDQAKQGIIFTDDDYSRLRSDLIKMSFDLGEEPAYKGKSYSGRGTPRHVLDWLKFEVAKPLRDKGLTKFTAGTSGGEQAEHWDEDLAYYWKDLEKLADNSESYKELRTNLANDLEEVHGVWKNGAFSTFQARVDAVYKMWRDIRPSQRLLKKQAMKDKLLGPQDAPDSISYWGKLKASVTFKRFYNCPKFVWRIAGVQLAGIKAEMQSFMEERPAFAVVPRMYVAHRLDRKMVKALAAKQECAESLFGFGSDVDEEEDA